MGRGPCTCCSNAYLNRGPWTPEEDALLMDYIKRQGDKGNWRKVPKAAGLLRCGKSCRLRWLNYLRPDIKRGKFSEDETDLIIRLHSLLGNRWSIIAGRVPGRSDNEIKNYWNFHLSKKLLSMGIDPKSHKPLPSLVRSSGRTGHGLDNSTTNLHSFFSRNISFSSICSSSLEASYSHSSGSNSDSRSSSCGFKLEPEDHDNVCQQPWSNLMRIEVLQPDQQEDQQEQKQKQKLRDRAQTGTGGNDCDSQGGDDDLNSKISNSSEYLDNFVPPDFDSSDDGMSTLIRGQTVFSLDFLDAPMLETDGMLEFIGCLQ